MKIPRTQPQAAFTMVEIAISLAVIGFALVAIIGVLPRGMQVQRQNREETNINQDAAVFLSAIRNGARGLDDLTNYVYEVRRYTQRYTLSKTNPFGPPSTNSYTYASSTTTPFFPITNGYHIIGLLSWPKYEPAPQKTFASNYVVAYARAISGPASEKPPQNNAEVQADAFSYQMVCENVAVPSSDGDTPYGSRLANNLHDLRLTFRWPLTPRGTTGTGRQTFRTQVGGQLLRTNDYGHTIFFFQPQTFAQPQP